MADHLAKVRQFDPDASEDVVDKIRKYCGIALENRDSSVVAATDEGEMDTVRNGFCKKELGLSESEAAAAVDAAAADMAGDRAKDRIVFYYLVAKHAGKLDVLG